MQPRDVLIGAVFAGVVALVALRARALTQTGAIAAFVVGTVTYGAGSLGFALILLAFFVPSVLLSRLGRARKQGLTDIGKHGARNAAQVLANGGVATTCAALWALTRDPHWAFAFAGAYAAATADTWATEIGTLAARAPRSILTLRPIATGLSGGVTLPGTLAEIAGAVWLGAVALVGIWLAFFIISGDFGFAWSPRTPRFHGVLTLGMLLAVPLAGIAGSTIDSLLGATIQELRYCERCGRNCETDPHVCGATTKLVRGVRGASNDLVNLVATVLGAGVAFALAFA